MGEAVTAVLAIIGAFLGVWAAGWMQLRRSREERRSQRMVEAYRDVAPLVEDVRRHAARALDWAETGPVEFDHGAPVITDPWEEWEVFRRRDLAHGPESATAPPIPQAAIALFGSRTVRHLMNQLDEAYTALRLARGEESAFYAEGPTDATFQSWRTRQRDHARTCLDLCDEVLDAMAAELRADVRYRQ